MRKVQNRCQNHAFQYTDIKWGQPNLNFEISILNDEFLICGKKQFY